MMTQSKRSIITVQRTNMKAESTSSDGQCHLQEAYSFVRPETNSTETFVAGNDWPEVHCHEDTSTTLSCYAL